MVSVTDILNQSLPDFCHDPRISPAHISLFLAILYHFQLQGSAAVEISKKEITQMAKISETTYHRCIHQLHAYGYIRYMPSFDPKKKSVVFLSSAA